MQLNPRQQQEVAQKVNDELEKVIMSWSTELKEWYPIAMRALAFASILEMRVPQSKYADLLKSTPHGINMNIVAVLANNLEARSPYEMKYEVDEWNNILELNAIVGRSWEGLCSPVRKKVLKEYEIMAARGESMRIIKAEA